LTMVAQKYGRARPSLRFCLKISCSIEFFFSKTKTSFTTAGVHAAQGMAMFVPLWVGSVTAELAYEMFKIIWGYIGCTPCTSQSNPVGYLGGSPALAYSPLNRFISCFSSCLTLSSGVGRFSGMVPPNFSMVS